MEGNQAGTLTHKGHRLPAWPKRPCGMSTCFPTEGWRGGRGLPAPAQLAMGSDSICAAHGISPWCLKLGPTDGDVVSVWGHSSGVALELSRNSLMVSPNPAFPHLCPS